MLLGTALRSVHCWVFSALSVYECTCVNTTSVTTCEERVSVILRVSVCGVYSIGVDIERAVMRCSQLIRSLLLTGNFDTILC